MAYSHKAMTEANFHLKIIFQRLLIQLRLPRQGTFIRLSPNQISFLINSFCKGDNGKKWNHVLYKYIAIEQGMKRRKRSQSWRKPNYILSWMLSCHSRVTWLCSLQTTYHFSVKYLVNFRNNHINIEICQFSVIWNWININKLAYVISIPNGILSFL